MVRADDGFRGDESATLLVAHIPRTSASSASPVDQAVRVPVIIEDLGG